LLPTVRSRCRILKLRPLADATVARVLAARMPDLDAADRTALAALAEGSPGRALHLAGEGGLDLYREMIGLIDTDRLDIAAVHALGDRLNRKNAEGAYRALTGLVLQWLERLVRGAAVAGEAVPELTANEGTLRQRLLAVRGLEDWLEVWEKAALRVAEADAANLERKQTVISLFAAIHRAAHV
jgi:DNA polymerase-3 subunit delta'